jgi:hypothetical protein
MLINYVLICLNCPALPAFALESFTERALSYGGQALLRKLAELSRRIYF